VKGKAEGIIVYQLMTLRDKATPEQLRAEALGEEAMQAYLARNFASVTAACRRLLELLPGDVSASALLARAEQLEKADVPEDWDGVMVLTDK